MGEDMCVGGRGEVVYGKSLYLLLMVCEPTTALKNSLIKMLFFLL